MTPMKTITVFEHQVIRDPSHSETEKTALERLNFSSDWEQRKNRHLAGIEPVSREETK